METASPSFRSKTFIFVLLAFAVIKLLLHFYTNAFAGYGIFRDELYYLACADHLAAGYVDHPPFSIHVLWFFRLLIGDSLFAIRAIVAVAGATTIIFTGMIVRRLGGGLIALILACTMVLLTPIYQAMNTYYSMNSLDILLWSVAFYLIIKIVQEDKLCDWNIFGIIVGLGMLNKISMGWLALGFGLGLLLSDQRKQLLTIRPWLAGGIALLLFSPFVIWNLTHDMAHLEFIHNATNYKYNNITRLDFIKGQLDMFNPTVVFISLAGLIYLFVNKTLRKYYIIGVIFVVSVLILYINGHSKPEYMSPAYPPLIAAGALLIERISRNRWMLWLPYVILFSLLIYGILSTPMAMPILSVEKYIRHARLLGIQQESNEGKELAELPQFYADMHGWESMAEDVAKVYHALPDSEKATTIVFANNYGDAGAIDYFRDKYDLPPVVCLHNNYWLWAKDAIEQPITTIIIIGGNVEDHRKALQSVEQVAVHRSQYAMPYETNLPIFVARDLKIPLQQIRINGKNFE